MAKTSYAVAIGSNRCHGTYGSPARTVAGAIVAMSEPGLSVERASKIYATTAVGPAGRGFANAVVIVCTELAPEGLLQELKSLELQFGRRRGRRWGARVLDLDILLWSQGSWQSQGLMIPHPAMRDRAFVLAPLAEIAPEWRDPITGLTIRQLLFRLQKPHPVDPHAAHP